MKTRLNCKQSWRSQVSEPSKRERLSSWLIQILLEQSHPSSFIFPALFVAGETWKPNDSIQNKTSFCSGAEEDKWNRCRKGSPSDWKSHVSVAVKRNHSGERQEKERGQDTGSHSSQTELPSCSNCCDPHSPSHTHPRSCSTLHQPGHPEASLLPRRSMLCSSASHSLQDQWEVPPVPRQPKCVGGSGIPACTRSQPQSICALKHCTISILSFFPHPSSHTISRRRKKLRFRLSGKVFPEERWWGEGDSCWAPCHAQEQRLFLLSRLQFFTCHLLWSHFAFISVV